MNCFILAEVLNISLLALSATPLPQGIQLKSMYASAAVGGKFTYQHVVKLDNVETVKSEEIVTVIAVQNKDGETIISETVTKDGKTNPHRKISLSEKGLFLLKDGETAFRDPQCLILLPEKSNNKWVTSHQWEDDLELEFENTTLGIEQIEVPAGKFSALRVDTKSTTEKKRFHCTTWYAHNVGVVKSVLTLAEYEVVITLQAYTIGKK